MTGQQRDAQDFTSAFEMTENMPVGMFVTEMLPDGTRQFVFVSNRLLHMLGLDRVDLMRDWRAIYANIHPDDFAAFLKPSEESWNGVTVFRWEGRVYVRGEVRWFLAESNPRPRPGGGAYWDGVIFDVTDRKRAEGEAETARRRELALAREKLLQLEHAMKSSLLAAAVAHDVKQPLATAVCHARQLVDRLGAERLDAESRNLLDRLAADARDVAASVDRMRGLLRVVETVPESFDMGHICASAILITRSRAAHSGIVLEAVVPPVAVEIMGDPAQIQVAILNLLTNAVQAVERGGGAERKIRVDLIDDDRSVTCVVGDSGPGYDAAASDGNTVAGQGGGTGMGLHIVHGVLSNHRGRLETGRSPLGGAEFRLILPRSRR